jgi:hypothetical protein
MLCYGEVQRDSVDRGHDHPVSVFCSLPPILCFLYEFMEHDHRLTFLSPLRVSPPRILWVVCWSPRTACTTSTSRLDMLRPCYVLSLVSSLVLSLSSTVLCLSLLCYAFHLCVVLCRRVGLHVRAARSRTSTLSGRRTCSRQSSSPPTVTTPLEHSNNTSLT